MSPAFERPAMNEPSERLNEYDKAEWFDVCRVMQPGLTWAEFEPMWEEFQQMKAEHQRQKGLQ